MTDNKFNPDEAISRAEVIMMLYNMAGQPQTPGVKLPFRDVTIFDPFYKAVAWAYDKGIDKGTSETTFSPNKDCTQIEVITMMYNYDRIYGKH